MSKLKTSLPYLLIILAVALWGMSFIWTNIILRTDVPVFTFIFFRMLIAGVSMLLVTKLIKKLQRIEKGDLKWFLLLVLFEPFIYFIGETFGIKLTNSPTVSALIIAIIPVLTMIVSALFFHEKLNLQKVLGAILTFVGVAIMVLFKGTISVEYKWGIALLLLATLGATGWGAVVNKLSSKYNPYTISTYQFLFATIYFLPLCLIFNDGYPLRQLLNIDLLAPLLSLAILCSCVAFSLYIYSIKSIGLTQTAVFTALIPGVSAVGAHFLGHETISIYEIVGICVVILGVILVQNIISSKKR